jgi:hypothetical protein
MDPSGRDLTNASRICGMIATILLALQILLLILFSLSIGGIQRLTGATLNKDFFNACCRRCVIVLLTSFLTGGSGQKMIWS